MSRLVCASYWARGKKHSLHFAKLGARKSRFYKVGHAKMDLFFIPKNEVSFCLFLKNFFVHFFWLYHVTFSLESLESLVGYFGDFLLFIIQQFWKAAAAAFRPSMKVDDFHFIAPTALPLFFLCS